MRAGKFPPAHTNGVRYLTIPVTFKNAEATCLTEDHLGFAAQ
jgi:hypothetical protein